MRFTLPFVLCALLVAVVAAGCGGKQTPSLPDVKATAGGEAGDEDSAVGDETKAGPAGEDAAATGEGAAAGASASAFGGELNLGDVRFPQYPGAKQEHSVTVSAEEEGKLRQVQLTTSESYEAVKGFYEQKLPKSWKKMEMNTDDMQMMQILSEEGGAQGMVVVSRSKKEGYTRIILSRMEKQD